MKKHIIFPIVTVVGGLAAFGLRLVQNRTGFEPHTGLPIPGNLPGLALVTLLTVLAALLLLLSRKLPGNTESPLSFPADFLTADAGLLMLPVAGVFLVALSGVVDLLTGTGFLGTGAVELPGIGTVHLFASHQFSSTVHMVLGAFSLISACAIFPAVVACRRKEDREPREDLGTWLLAPSVMLVIRLVLTYRVDSVNPSLEAYYVELLALVFLTLGFYRLASFAFHASRPRLFAVYCGVAAVLSLTALADTDLALSSLLLYLGGAAVLLGFLILLLTEGSAPAAPTEPEE